jgi:hypothetical protein
MDSEGEREERRGWGTAEEQIIGSEESGGCDSRGGEEVTKKKKGEDKDGREGHNGVGVGRTMKESVVLWVEWLWKGW